MKQPDQPELITRLLVQDMKHEQLLDALSRVGMDVDVHSLDLFTIIAGLMGLEEDEISWDWSDTYMDYMKKAAAFPVTLHGEPLQPLALECYQKLAACAAADLAKREKK